MSARLVLSIALFVAVAECVPSSRNDRVCVPVQWEGVGLGKVAQISQGQGQVLTAVGHFSADYNKKKVVFIESVYSEDKFVGNYTYLRTEAASYLIDTINMQCRTLPATKVLRLCSDLDILTHKASMSIGKQMVDVYDLAEEDSKSTITVLRDDFTPVSEVVEQTILGIPQMSVLQFGNLTTGIRDDTVFDLPSYC